MSLSTSAISVATVIATAPQLNDNLSLGSDASCGFSSTASSGDDGSTTGVPTTHTCYDDLVVAEQDTPPITSRSCSSNEASDCNPPKQATNTSESTLSNNDSTKRDLRNHFTSQPKIATATISSCVFSARPISESALNVPHLTVIRNEPLPSPPLQNGKLTRTNSFIYQHYETPTAKVTFEAVDNSDPIYNTNRTSGTQNRIAKFRQGFMNILKRRSKSGDRLSAKQQGDEAVVLAFDESSPARLRGQSIDRVLFAKSLNATCDGIRSIKAVLSATSLHYINCSGKQSHSSEAASEVTMIPDPGQYEELPNTVSELGYKGSSVRLKSAVGNRLFRRRSSSALPSKPKPNNPRIFLRSHHQLPAEDFQESFVKAPDIPLPSPPVQSGIKSPTSSNGDYDPLISFVEITPVRRYPSCRPLQPRCNSAVLSTSSVANSQNISNSSNISNNEHHEKTSEKGFGDETPPKVNENASYYYAPANSLTINNFNNSSSSNADVMALLDGLGSNENDDDSFHREFSLALSILHSQSQDLEKATLLINSSLEQQHPFLINSPIGRAGSAVASPDLGAPPMKPARSSSATPGSKPATPQQQAISKAEDGTPTKPASPPAKSPLVCSGKPPLPPSVTDRKSSSATTSSGGSTNTAPIVPAGPLIIAQSLEQCILACESVLMSRIRLEPAFINRLASEKVITPEFSSALLQLADRVATRMALLREITANSLSSPTTVNDEKLRALCAAFKRELNDNDTALMLTSVYAIFKLINTLSENSRISKQSNSSSDSLHKFLFESDKSVLVEVVDSGQSSNRTPMGSVQTGGSSGDLLMLSTDATSADNDPKGPPVRSKFFSERKRLRQFSQSALQLGPKFSLAVCIVNFQREFGDAGAIQLANLATAYNNIIELSLPNAGVGVEGAMAIAKMLNNDCCCLKQLNLAANKLGNDGVKAILRAVEVNRSLRSINLGANGFSGDACNLDLTHAFSANRTLLELDLSYNDIGDGGAAALGFALSTSGGLEKLRLRRCGLNNHSMAKVLAILAESKCRLIDLDISVNSLAPDCFSMIVRNLAHSQRTISCQLQSCGIKDLSSLTHESLKYFRELDFSQCPIGDAGASHIIQALSSGNATLNVLSLNSCDLTLRSCRELVTAVRNTFNVLSILKLCNNFKLLSDTCALCTSGSTTAIYSTVACHHNETIRVVEVDNLVSGKKAKVYCTLAEPNQLLGKVDNQPTSAMYEAVDVPSPVESNNP